MTEENNHVNIKRKLLAAAATVTLATGLAAISAPSAHAAALSKIDVSGREVTCNDVLGKIKFATPLTIAGGPSNSITVSVKSGDCVDNDFGPYDCTDGSGVAGPNCANPQGITLKGYSAKGILNVSPDSGCLGLQGLSTNTSGTVTGKFTTASTSRKIVSGDNTFTINQTYGGTFNDGGATSPASDSASWSAQYGLFRIGTAAGTVAPTVSGAYSNGGNASNFLFDGTTAQSTGDIATQCFGTGVKSLSFGIGGFTT